MAPVWAGKHKGNDQYSFILFCVCLFFFLLFGFFCCTNSADGGNNTIPSPPSPQPERELHGRTRTRAGQGIARQSKASKGLCELTRPVVHLHAGVGVLLAREQLDLGAAVVGEVGRDGRAVVRVGGREGELHGGGHGPQQEEEGEQGGGLLHVESLSSFLRTFIMKKIRGNKIYIELVIK